MAIKKRYRAAVVIVAVVFAISIAAAYYLLNMLGNEFKQDAQLSLLNFHVSNKLRHEYPADAMPTLPEMLRDLPICKKPELFTINPDGEILDVWGNPIILRWVDNVNYELVSKGRDGIIGTDDDYVWKSSRSDDRPSPSTVSRERSRD